MSGWGTFSSIAGGDEPVHEIRLNVQESHIEEVAINLATILGMAVAVYAWSGMRNEDVHRFRSKVDAGRRASRF
jgi:hypothetical protein